MDQTTEQYIPAIQRILNATKELLVRRSTGSFSTVDVAKIALTTQPLIHYHFMTKANLIEQAFLQLLKENPVAAQRVFDRENACEMSYLTGARSTNPQPKKESEND